MNTNPISKQVLAVGAVVVVIIAIVLVVVLPNKKSSDVIPVADQANESVTQTPAAKKPTTSTKPAPVSTPTPTKGMSRTDALAMYQDHIVRISDTCVSVKTPQSFVVPVGTTFMIDNDGTRSHQVKVGERTVTLASKTYTLETLDEQGYVSSTCDPKTGTTTVTIHRD